MAESYEVKITNYALSQMQEIEDYISQVLMAPNAARNWLSDMYSAFSSLDTFPSRVPLTEEAPWNAKGVHKLVVNNFLAYFWIDEEHHIVWIIAVIYGRRDQKKQLKNVPI